jgi:hypothetical protein
MTMISFAYVVYSRIDASLCIFICFYCCNIGYSQCSHSIDLTDTYGDGWNGGTVDVLVNGTAVLSGITLATGSGPQNFTFSAGTGDLISVTQTSAGSWPGEMRIQVYDGNGTAIIVTQLPVPAPGVSGNGFCPNPDNPCGGIGLVTCTSRQAGSNVGMTDSGIPTPGCGSYAGGDCWYSVQVPASGEVQTEAYSGTLTDMAMAVYTASGGCGGALSEAACDDNSGEGNMPMVTVFGLTPGSTAYIRIWDNLNDQTGTFTIEARDAASLLCFTGDATDLGSGCAQLTSASNNQNGAIWDADDLLDFGGDFTYDFTINLGSNDGGADGMAFVMHNDPSGLATTGVAGGSLGAGGIASSLIVEIDTYLNTEDRDDNMIGVVCSGGPGPDHLDIWTGGNVNPELGSSCVTDAGERIVSAAVPLTLSGADYNIENGLDHLLRVSYISATQTFTAEVLNTAGSTSYGSITYTSLNPVTLFGTTTPYFGFTASTGGLNNLQSGCIASAFTSLPVELLNFQVACYNSSVSLQWETGAELNNDFFVVQRSVDGRIFEDLSHIAGSGNTNSAAHYQWTDMGPGSEICYYRIKQVDFDGTASYSMIRVASCEKIDISIGPNPTDGLVYISHSLGKTQFEVRNSLGQIVSVCSQVIDIESIQIDMSSVPGGVYFLSIGNFQAFKTYKLIVK